jgi:hypothetical protein
MDIDRSGINIDIDIDIDALSVHDWRLEIGDFTLLTGRPAGPSRRFQGVPFL